MTRMFSIKLIHGRHNWKAADKIARVNLHVLLDLGVVESSADEPLGGVEGILRVGDGLTLSGHACQSLALC